MKISGKALASIRSMKDRRYAVVSIDEIIVPNSRNREELQFQSNVNSIKAIGLLKPVVVNEHYLSKTGKYELVCGEGRLLAYKRIGKSEIEAEILDVERKYALLMSLVENIARVQPGTMWFAMEIKKMNDEGMSVADIATIVGKADGYVTGYLRLVSLGEERLIRGVEKGLFPIQFALRVVEAPTPDVQHVLMDAYDSKLITMQNFTQVKRIIMLRADRKGIPTDDRYTAPQLKKDIIKITRDKETFIKEAERREARLVSLIDAMDLMMEDAEFVELLKREGLADRPVLSSEKKSNSAPSPESTNAKEEINAQDT